MSDILANKAPLIRLASLMAEGSTERKDLLNVITRSASSMLAAREAHPEWVELFDSLKKGDNVKIAWTAVMGMSRAESGQLLDWTVHNVSKGNGYQAITLLHQDKSKPTKHNAYRLWRRIGNDGEPYISASMGDMALTLKSLQK